MLCSYAELYAPNPALGQAEAQTRAAVARARVGVVVHAAAPAATPGVGQSAWGRLGIQVVSRRLVAPGGRERKIDLLNMKMHWFKIDPSFWLGSPTINYMAPTEQLGLLRLLFADAFEDGVADDDDKMATISLLGDAWFNGSGPVIRAWFKSHPHRPGVLTSEIVQRQREEYEKWIGKSKKGGEASARKRRGISDFGKTLVSNRWDKNDTKGGARVVEPPLRDSDCDCDSTKVHTQSERSGPSPSSEVVVPSLAEVIEWGKFDAVPEQECRAFFDYYDGLGWMQGRTPIRNPRRWLKSWVERSKQVRPSRTGSGGSDGSRVFQKKTRLEELQKLWLEHPGNPQANCSAPGTTEERAEFRQMTKEIQRLRQELARGL